MNRSKILAIVFSVFTFGAAQETIRIITSDAIDISENRTELIPMSIGLTALFLFLSIRFWLKANTKTM